MHKVATPARLVASALPRSPEIPGSAKSFGARVQARHGPRRHDLSIDRASPATAPRAARSFAPFAVAPPQWRSGTLPQCSKLIRPARRHGQRPEAERKAIEIENRTFSSRISRQKHVVSTNHGRRKSSILGASLISATSAAVRSPKYLIKIASAKPNVNVDRSLAIGAISPSSLRCTTRVYRRSNQT
jgi:hypothetical protein